MQGASPAAEKAVVKPLPDAGGETFAVASPPALPQVFSAKVDLMEGSAVSPGSLSYDGTTGMVRGVRGVRGVVASLSCLG